MAELGEVCVLIPTLDEEETIGSVIDGFRAEGFDEILVMDGNSTDDTRAIAADRGARVEIQTGSGKGQAVREALSLVESEYVLLVDGDGTYRPEDASAMLEPMLEREAKHVIGNRFANMEPGAMTWLNRVGNRLINWAFQAIHGEDFRDILSGYRAFKLNSARGIPLSAEGFGIEAEFAVECVKNDIDTAVVPITYRSRPADSDANLRPFRDGAVIVVTLYQLARTNNPLFYFGSIGLVSMLTGGFVATYVGIEWFAFGVSHEVLAIAAAFGLLFGMQFVMFGVLSDMILAVFREQTQRFESSKGENRSDRPEETS